MKVKALHRNKEVNYDKNARALYAKIMLALEEKLAAEYFMQFYYVTN